MHCHKNLDLNELNNVFQININLADAKPITNISKSVFKSILNHHFFPNNCLMNDEPKHLCYSNHLIFYMAV